ncbi:hypothetical protein, partial [Duganella sp. 3397]|uniref:hypothetical protein n=1 Tax=Duganella sp. 3397 TaxID=2817732 RepID=UPI00286B358D
TAVLLAEEAFCSSAKRQDYEAFRIFRQALLFLLYSRFTLHLHVLFCEGANYSNTLPNLQELFSRCYNRCL